MMLEGQRPKECDYCWKIEDTKGETYSDRFIKSLDDWAYPRLQEVLKHPWDAPIKPAYVELMLDNTCNFNCSYCFADISTSIAQEMKKFGPLAIKNNTHRELRDKKYGQSSDDNPYLKAFWEWLPDILDQLKVLRLTGGEPLLSRHTLPILEHIKKVRPTQLNFAINSNLGVRFTLLEQFIGQIKSLLENKVIREFELYTSVDTYGEQAEFIRNGLNYDSYIENLIYVSKQLPQSQIVLMCTYNILSIPRFNLFLEQIAKLKKQIPHLVLDISYLKEPEYLRANLANQELKEKVKSDLNLMKSLGEFSAYEIDKLERICAWVEEGDNSTQLDYHRSDFYLFIKDYSKRVNKNFDAIFPELVSFYNECRKSQIKHSYFLSSRDV